MHCDSLVINSHRVTGKGKTLHHRTVMMRETQYGGPEVDMELVERFQRMEGPKWTIDNVFDCGGEIQATVAVETEAYSDGSPTLEISYYCTRCRCQFYHAALPNQYDIEDWLNRRISGLPQDRPARPASEVEPDSGGDKKRLQTREGTRSNPKTTRLPYQDLV